MSGYMSASIAKSGASGRMSSFRLMHDREQCFEQLPAVLESVETPIPIAGWFGEENRRELARLIVEHNVKSVVEIGSFLGLSAVWFAQRVDSVTCVDLWFEPANHETENNLVGTLRRWDLPNDFFPLFRDNVMRSGLWHKIRPVRGNSHFVYGEVPFVDLAYIDGDHSYEGCKRDIEIYREKARVVLCGDDYVEREGFGVIEAVNELLPGHKSAGCFWWAELA